LCKVAAPLLPLLTESVYKGLTQERSVHLCDWPGEDDLPADASLVAAMDLVREVCSAGHAVRKSNGLRSRLPLRKLVVAGPGTEVLAPYVELLKDELNVKDVVLTDDVATVARRSLTLVPSVLGPMLGPDTQKVIAAVRRGEWRELPGAVEAAGVHLRAEDGGYELRLKPLDERSSRALAGERAVVSLDLGVDNELESEGTARDVVRLVQSARRDAGLDVSDCIDLEIEAAAEVVRAADEHRIYICEQTLAMAIEVRPSSDGETHVRVTKVPCRQPRN